LPFLTAKDYQSNNTAGTPLHSKTVELLVTGDPLTINRHDFIAATEAGSSTGFVHEGKIQRSTLESERLFRVVGRRSLVDLIYRNRYADARAPHQQHQ
jgi:hypothetical protein